MQTTTIATSLRDYLRILFHRKWYIIFFTLSSLLVFSVYVFAIAPEIYEARNVFHVGDKGKIEPLTLSPEVSPLHGMMMDIFKEVKAREGDQSMGIYEVLAGISEVADQFPWSETCLAARDGYLAARVRLSDRAVEVVLLERREIRHKLALLGKLRAGEAIHAEGIERQGTDERAFQRLTHRVKEEIELGYRGSDLTIRVRTLDPVFSRRLVDRLFDQIQTVYWRGIRTEVDRTGRRNLTYYERAQRSLSKLLEEKKHLLEKNADKPYLINYTSPASAAPVDGSLPKGGQEIHVNLNNGGQASPVRVRMGKLREARDRTKTEVRSLVAQIGSLEAKLRGVSELVTTVEEQVSPRRARLDQRLIELELELADMVALNTPEHPDWIALEKKIASLRKIRDQMSVTEIASKEISPNPVYIHLHEQLGKKQSTLSGKQSKLRELEVQLGEQGDIAEGEPGFQTRLRKLDDAIRIENNAVNVYGGFVTRWRRTKETLEGGGGVFFSRRQETEKQARPVEPKKALLMFLGLIIGLVFSATAVFFVEYADHSIKGIEDVRRFLGLPVLGVIPDCDLYNHSSQSRFRFLNRFRGHSRATVGTAAVLGLLIFGGFQLLPNHEGSDLFDWDARPATIQTGARPRKTGPHFDDLTQIPAEATPEPADETRTTDLTRPEDEAADTGKKTPTTHRLPDDRPLPEPIASPG